MLIAHHIIKMGGGLGLQSHLYSLPHSSCQVLCVGNIVVRHKDGRRWQILRDHIVEISACVLLASGAGAGRIHGPGQVRGWRTRVESVTS